MGELQMRHSDYEEIHPVQDLDFDRVQEAYVFFLSRMSGFKSPQEFISLQAVGKLVSNWAYIDSRKWGVPPDAAELMVLHEESVVFVNSRWTQFPDLRFGFPYHRGRLLEVRERWPIEVMAYPRLNWYVCFPGDDEVPQALYASRTDLI